MNIDKAKKRIAKHVKKGFHGYPQIEIIYEGQSDDCASAVLLQFTLQEGDVAQEQRFACQGDARHDEQIQTTLLKVIERAGAVSVLEAEAIKIV
ncbi:hypothetical protein DBZ36_07755 [Alginatibacterium sediminis]|uniref:Uncharacterized protein n=1 Tax=Alginatibacterium sediminis TaxID=2164068 RepID=A0A420EHZ9_9ALTE|nr:hypothetical protein [Alginatibacterium sediminis]RKF20325.1 hypothetical protein DBZ36_07755 [Alginatibacterium sediminis]